MRLRFYQQDVSDQALDLLATEPEADPLLVLPTGAGKTMIMGHLTGQLQSVAPAQAAIAHRHELVAQIAMAYAKAGIPHRIVGSEATVRDARAQQLEEYGRSLIDPTARVGVCSVDTLVARPDDPWMAQVTHGHWDEAHHCLDDNKWGRAKAKFPRLKSSIGYTATPRRADRKPLRGFFSNLIEGPTMRDLIDWGFLTDYRMVTGKVTDLDLQSVSVAANGDFNPQQLRAATKKSRQIVGDAVELYKRFCPGARAVLFAVDTEDAARYREAFVAAGIPAEVVTAKTDAGYRRHCIRQLKSGELKVLINVDLFGEGFDLPAIECVIMARPTKSLPLYHQQFGRALRLVIEKWLMKMWNSLSVADRLNHIAGSAKPRAIIIDMVKNWAMPECGGLPDARGRVWSLDGARKQSNGPSDVMPLRECMNPYPVEYWNGMPPDLRQWLNEQGSKAQAGTPVGPVCTEAYERYLGCCPECGWIPVATQRTIEAVDGDLDELDAETLARLRGDVAQLNTTPAVYGPHAAAVQARHRERFYAVEKVKTLMTYFGPAFAIREGRPLSDREQRKAFYLTFGVDTLSAQALSRADADALSTKVLDWMNVYGFTILE